MSNQAILKQTEKCGKCGFNEVEKKGDLCWLCKDKEKRAEGNLVIVHG